MINYKEVFCTLLQWRYTTSTVNPVLFKIQAKSLQSASRVFPHDRAFCCPLHINNQLFVEVQAATTGMTYCWGHRDERLLEACFSKKKKKWEQAFSIQCPLSNDLCFKWVVSWVLGLNPLQRLRLIPSLDVQTESWPFHWSAGKGKCYWKRIL